ncbi:MAG: hypothetical protein HN350_13950 [Phycisphaerales bacterium]|jgi:hypothetical protein|nr:hypothetical protein [Phycisphaerales bacterium]
MRKIMKNTNFTVSVVVLLAALVCSFMIAEARGPSDRDKSSRKRPSKSEATLESQMRRYAFEYKLSEDQQAALLKVLTAQQKDIADYNKVYGTRLQAVDEKIKVLQDEIAAFKKAKQAEIDKLEKSKDVYKKVRSELALDHKAEFDQTIPAENKLKRLAGYLKGGGEATMYWKHLPKELQDSLDQKYQTAAAELITTDKSSDNSALRAVRIKLQTETSAILTPEVRNAAETKALNEMMLRSFTRYELTDDQKLRINDLCAESTKGRVLAASRYEKLRKEYDTARRARSGGSIYKSYAVVREAVAEKVLTEDQKKKLPQKRKSTSKKDKVRSEKKSKKKSE